MKYIYYYIWVTQCAFSYFFIRRPIFWLVENIGTRVFSLKKLEEKKVKREKRDFNKFSYDFPDGVTHWYTFGFMLVMFMTLFFLIPLFTIDFFGNFIINSLMKCVAYLLFITGFPWYCVYIKKSNKEWLKKKIDKKKRDFYL